MRPDEAEKIKSLIREKGTYKVIDKVNVELNEKRDVYEAQLFSLGIKGVVVPTATVKQYEKLLVGGIWALVTLEYFFEEGQKGSPFSVRQLKPIQMPNMDMDELWEGRKHFTAEQWLDVLLRSSGMEPTTLDTRVKWHLLARMIPVRREQLQRLRARAARHGQEPHLQGGEPEQHPDLGRADHGRQPLLQPGAPADRSGGRVGRGGLR